MKPVLLLGRSGQIGWELERCLQPLGRVVACSRAEADLGRPESLRTLIEDVHPGIIVNAAAYTAVDAAEESEAEARVINAESPGVLAQLAAKHDAWLVHYSTDYVFDGTAAPYRESAPTCPLNAYGRTKAAGEEAILNAGCHCLIFRTSWVYSSRGNNFLKTILRISQERESLSIVNDQIGAPTWSRTIADTTATVLSRLQDKPSASDCSGIYHLTSQGHTSWFDFARFILDRARPFLQRIPEVKPMSTKDYAAAAPRPMDSRLDCSRLVRTFDVHLPDWEAAALLCLNEIREQAVSE